MGRDQVKNWKPYVYTLLKAFDDVAYKDMKKAANPPPPEAQEKAPPKQPQPVQPQQLRSPEKQLVSGHTFNASAAEFIPGTQWSQQSPKASLDCGPNAAADADALNSPTGVVKLTPSPKKSPPSPRGEAQDGGFFGWAGCCAERGKEQR